MPELPQVNPGEIIDSTTFGNPVVDRVVSRYADPTERDALDPSPSNGAVCYVESGRVFQVFTGSTWDEFRVNTLTVTSGGAAITGDIDVTGNIVGAGQVQANSQFIVQGVGSTSRIIMRRDAATHEWRFNLQTNGQLLLQSSPFGANTWTTIETWVPA